MNLIIYKDIPCPILVKEEPDTFLILFKGEQKWIFECLQGYGEIEKNKNGIFYVFNGKYHRENGSACEYSGGDRYWYKNGKIHRLNKPAVEYSDGSRFWYISGRKHRLDGSACEWNTGDKAWYIEGKQYSENDYLEKIEEMKRDGTYII